MDIQTAREKLKGCFYEDCIQDDENGAWLRVDTDDNTPKDAYTEYCMIQEELRSYGVVMAEVQIEHDCISGDLVEFEEP